jgi:hypothetical protein
MAYLGTSGYGYRLPGTSKKLLEDMKKHVSRVCGLTEKDFRREKDGTEKSTDEKECDICDGRLGDCGSVSCNILKHSAD